MSQYFARIVSGVVAEIITIPDGVEIAACFVPAIVETLEPATSSTAVGQTFADGVFGAAVAPPAPTQAQLQAYATAKAQTLLGAMNSYTAAGTTIKADANASTVADLLALAQWGAANPTAAFNWIADDNSVTAITGAQLVALAPLVCAYRMTVYGIALAAVLAEIHSGAITTTAQIDAYAWPS